MVTRVEVASGRFVHFGRVRPSDEKRAALPKLRDYFVASKQKLLPTPPGGCDYSGAARSILADVMGNDAEGDCVIAAGYHIVGTETANAGDPFHATLAQVNADYGAIGGYVPGDPSTDNGCDEATAIGYWTSNGFADGTKLAGSLLLDASNQQELMLACYLFENLFFGTALPDAWISPFPSKDGFSWDVAGAANPNNGHGYMGCGYSPGGVYIGTWGLIGAQTWRAIAKYNTDEAGGDVYVLVTPDQLAKGQTRAPNGIAWTDLLADLVAMGGAPAPAPAPPPPAPGPTPSSLSLADAQAALARGWPGS